MFHLKLLPLDACPTAILITSGAMNINLVNAQSLLAKVCTTLYVIVEDISNKRSAGFHSGI